MLKSEGWGRPFPFWRSLLCDWAPKELCMNVSDLSQRSNLMQPAASIAVRLGEKLAKINSFSMYVLQECRYYHQPANFWSHPQAPCPTRRYRSDSYHSHQRGIQERYQNPAGSDGKTFARAKHYRFKREGWRRPWCVQIHVYLTASIQIIMVLLRYIKSLRRHCDWFRPNPEIRALR